MKKGQTVLMLTQTDVFESPIIIIIITRVRILRNR